MLKIRFKHKKQNAVWLVEPKVRIGKNDRNDLVVESEDVADLHAEILVEHETLTLVNRSQGQVLLVNDQAVKERCPLLANDRVMVGSTELVVVDPKLEAKVKKPAAVAPVKASASGWALKSNHSALKNKVFSIDKESLVGRSNDCDITLAAAHLSRKHARLSLKNDRLRVTDLDSANGTYVNGKRVKEAWLSRGDELRFDTLAFGVIGPSDDLDKTTIRPVPAPSAAQGQNVRPVRPAKVKAATQVKRKAASTPGKEKPGKQSSESPQSPRRMGRAALVLLLVVLGLGTYYVIKNFK